MISKRISKKKSDKYVQSFLQLGSDAKGQKKDILIKCKDCNLTYFSNSIKDLSMHKNYHQLQIHGRTWNDNWGKHIEYCQSSKKSKYKQMTLVSLTPPRTSSSGVKDVSNSNERIVEVRKGFKSEINALKETMDIVNEELQAPIDENDFWIDPNMDGKAFAYIKNNRIVGVITIEVITNQSKGRWMVYETSKIIDHVKPNFDLGISRIWVCREQRGNGIAGKLLEVARCHTINGKTVNKFNLAWSQPSEMGGKLASIYNGVTHKSGKLLIPCYL